jgi:hypothetical protein
MHIQIRYPVARFLGDRRRYDFDHLSETAAFAFAMTNWLYGDGAETVEAWELTPTGKPVRLLIALIGAKDGADYATTFCGGMRMERGHSRAGRVTKLTAREIERDERFRHAEWRRLGRHPYQPSVLATLERTGRRLAAIVRPDAVETAA